MNDGDSKCPREKESYLGSSDLGRVPVGFVEMERKKERIQS